MQVSIRQKDMAAYSTTRQISIRGLTITDSVMNITALIKSEGFSLLEMLVAISIFSVISLSVFLTMDQYFSTTEILSQREEQFATMNRFFQMIERDVQYAVNRKVRNPYGESQATIVVGPVDDNELLSFTSSFPDYSHEGLSRLVRVSWSFHDGDIVRSYWQVLDQAQDTEPIRHKILTGVKDVQLVIKPDLEAAKEVDSTNMKYHMELLITPQSGVVINRQIRFFGEF